MKGMLREKDAMKGEIEKRDLYGDEAFNKTVWARYKMNAMYARLGLGHV